MPSDLQNGDAAANPFYRPEFRVLFDRVRQIKDPVKLRILQQLLDGEWHDENELVRLAKKFRYTGSVGLGMMIEQIRRLVDETFVIQEGKPMPMRSKYKLNDNFVGLTRAAFHTFSRSRSAW